MYAGKKTGQQKLASLVSWVLYVWSLHVLPPAVWILFVYSGQIPALKDKHFRLISDSKLAIDVSVSQRLSFFVCQPRDRLVTCPRSTPLLPNMTIGIRSSPAMTLNWMCFQKTEWMDGWMDKQMDVYLHKMPTVKIPNSSLQISDPQTTGCKNFIHKKNCILPLPVKESTLKSHGMILLCSLLQ